MPPRIEPKPGDKNWKSNPAGAVKIWQPEGEPGHSVYQREHFDGQLDGRVGGTYVDQETEARYAKGQVIVTRQNGQQMTQAEYRAICEAAHAAWRADPHNPQLRAVHKKLASERSAMREALRRADPRRSIYGGAR
jgi:hypothetical protein